MALFAVVTSDFEVPQTSITNQLATLYIIKYSIMTKPVVIVDKLASLISIFKIDKGSLKIVNQVPNC